MMTPLERSLVPLISHQGCFCLKTLRKAIAFAYQYCMYDFETDPQFVEMVVKFYRRHYSTYPLPPQQR